MGKGLFTVVVLFSLFLSIISPLTVSLDLQIITRTKSMGSLVNNDVTEVLFIGSSYFNFNYLPTLFENLAISSGKDVFVERFGRNGLFLYDHAFSSETEAKINERDWDYVVLQGVGVNMAYPEYDLAPPVYPALEELKDKIHLNCESTKMIFCMPWAFEDGMTWYQNWTDTFEDMQLKIFDNTLKYSDEIGFSIAPVGWAWYRVLDEQDYQLHYLHMSDWNHPTLEGSYLMACTIFSTLFRESSAGLSFISELSRDEATYFQMVATDTVMDNLTLWNIEGSTIIYVDDDNNEGPWDGTIEHPYHYIQDGIDASTDGDTVLVKNGIYYENLTVDKSIYLHGEDKEDTIIDGVQFNNSIEVYLKIISDNVIISKFTITNSNESFRTDFGISLVESSDCIIKECIIYDCSRALELIDSSAYITDNMIIRMKVYDDPGYCGDTGIGVWSSDVLIEGNSIKGDYSTGIFCGFSNCTIINNVIQDTITYAIHLSDIGVNGGSIVKRNHIQNAPFGLFLECSISPVEVKENNFIQNRVDALFSNCLFVTWDMNYWGRLRLLPKPILGFYGIYPSIPTIAFDRNPAEEPYDII